MSLVIGTESTNTAAAAGISSSRIWRIPFDMVERRFTHSSRAAKRARVGKVTVATATMALSVVPGVKRAFVDIRPHYGIAYRMNGRRASPPAVTRRLVPAAAIQMILAVFTFNN